MTILVTLLSLKVVLLSLMVVHYWRRARLLPLVERALVDETGATRAVSMQLAVKDKALAFALAQQQQLEQRLATIATIITRRPPRRRWLALARRVAKEATV